MKIRSLRIAVFCVPLFLSCVCLAQVSESFEKERHKQILSLVKETVKKNYFDPTFKATDLEAKFNVALASIDKARSMGQLNSIIAKFLLDFDDSHLLFVPPGKASKTDYGFDYQMAGPKCLITRVKASSDARAKGLEPGDEMLALNGIRADRDSLWKLRYFFRSLQPQAALNVSVLKLDGSRKDYAVVPKVTPGKLLTDLTDGDYDDYMRTAEDEYSESTRQYIYDKDPGVFIWKMPAFSIEPDKAGSILGRAKKFPSIVFDLRGNGGGRVDTLLRMLGGLFPQDVKVADEKRRKGTKDIIAKSRGKDAYDGKVVVLIDGESASASEVFSKVVQLEKRGTVIGDRSAGAVMESMFFTETVGLDVVVVFGTNVTIADLIMKDGKSLEKVGVTPDLVLFPSPQDVSTGKDIVLSKALETLGVAMTPEAAGKLFPASEKYK